MGHETAARIPDALLAKAEREGKGKLRVFLGAAPASARPMPCSGGQGRAGGRHDVVVGIVETHGRRETEAMVEGAGRAARRAIHYRGHLVPEFDLEAAPGGRPKLLLVDEFAHSNVPGSRHPKRWQDVEDLWTRASMCGPRSTSSIWRA